MAAITSAVVGVAGSVISSRQASRQARQQNELAREGIDAADPFREHRAGAATRLNALMADPSSIKDSAAYKARMQAVQRQLAAQGYTGSGNALVEAAEASGAAYQQEFDNLAMLSGANQAPGGGFSNAMASRAQSDATRLSGTTGIINNVAAGIRDIGGFNRPGRINVPQSAVPPIRRTPIPVPRPRGG